MKIFWCVLQELNSDGEDPDLESEEIYFDSAQTIENFLSNLKFRDYLLFLWKMDL